MKRLSLALLIAAASGLIAAGCGGDDEDDGAEGGEATTETGSISVPAPADVATTEDQIEQLYKDCIASLELIPENAREEAREGCEALKP